MAECHKPHPAPAVGLTLALAAKIIMGKQMISSLRKGSSSVYFQYESTGESMGAEEFEAEVKNNILIFRFKVKPVDSNQREDEEHLHEMELLSVTVDDDYIITRFIDFIKNKSIEGFHVEVFSRGKRLVFSVSEGPSKLNGLTFNIENKVS